MLEILLFRLLLLLFRLILLAHAHAPPRLVRDDAQNRLDHLVKRQVRRIDRHGVLCRAERVNSAVRVLFVAGAQIAQHIVEIRVHALIDHLLIAAAGAFLGAGSQKDFDGRVHQHTRANIAAIHQHGRFLRKGGAGARPLPRARPRT